MRFGSMTELSKYLPSTFYQLYTIHIQYPLDLWNHNKDAADGLARTTNTVEGWHLGVTSFFQGNNPCI